MATLNSKKEELAKEAAREKEQALALLKMPGTLDEQISQLTKAKMEAEQQKAEIEKTVVSLRRKKSALESRVRTELDIVETNIKWKIACKRKGTYQLQQELLGLEKTHQQLSEELEERISSLQETGFVYLIPSCCTQRLGQSLKPTVHQLLRRSSKLNLTSTS